MAQSCLKCLKYIMCAVNFLCFISGMVMVGLAIYVMRFQLSSLVPSLDKVSMSKLLLTSGIIITCISFLGFIGALKENRCFLLTFFILLLILMLAELTAACLLLIFEKEIGDKLKEEMLQGLKNTKANFNSSSNVFTSEWDVVQEMFECCGVYNSTDWGDRVPASCCKNNLCPINMKDRQGCLVALTNWFDKNFLTTGIAVIFLCVIEVLGMCFSMTLFCHISRSGLGYKL